MSWWLWLLASLGMAGYFGGLICVTQIMAGEIRSDWRRRHG